MSVRIQKPDRDQQIFSPGEACWHMGVSWNTLKGLIRSGDIYAKPVGRRYLIPRAALDEWLNKDRAADKVFIQSLLKGRRLK